MALGATLRTIRKDLKKTQKHVAEKSGLSITYLSKIESGVQRNIGVETLSVLAEALDRKVKIFLEPIEPKAATPQL